MIMESLLIVENLYGRKLRVFSDTAEGERRAVQYMEQLCDKFDGGKEVMYSLVRWKHGEPQDPPLHTMGVESADTDEE